MKDSASRLSKVEITARGQVFSKEVRFGPRHQTYEEFKVTNEELANKFRHLSSRVLPWSKIDRAVDTVMNLEKVNDVSQLVQQLCTVGIS